MSLKHYGLFLLVFLLVRVALVYTPWSSDDIDYLDMAQRLNDGSHVIQSPVLPANVGHAGLRFGLLLPLALMIRVFGYTIFAYYALPIFFSAVGFLVIMKIMLEVLPKRVAMAMAVLHIVSPFEIRHSSMLITDLPAAALTLLYVYFIYKTPLQSFSSWKLFARSFAASLLLFWPYLMRDNQPVLLLPALAVFLANRRYRPVVMGSMALLAVWILLEQSFYMAKGAPFGFRWTMLAIAQKAYMPFLAKAAPIQYFFRSFNFVFKDVGWFGVAYFIAALAAHVHTLFTSKNVLVRSCLAAGLFTYVLFYFYIYARIDGNFIVMTAAHRFVQLFSYTSLLALGCSATRLAPRVQQFFTNSLAFPLAFHRAQGVLIVISVLSFTTSSYFYPGPLLGGERGILPTLAALDAGMSRDEPSPITLVGTQHSLRVMSLFSRTIAGHALVFEARSHQVLLESIEKQNMDWFFIDPDRERIDLRYLKDDALAERQRTLEQINARLDSDYNLVVSNKHAKLYHRRPR